MVVKSSNCLKRLWEPILFKWPALVATTFLNSGVIAYNNNSNNNTLSEMLVFIMICNLPNKISLHL